MRLDEIEWYRRYDGRREADLATWCIIVQNSNGTYHINAHRPNCPRDYSYDETTGRHHGTWNEIDPATAQAILFNLFGYPEGNNA